MASSWSALLKNRSGIWVCLLFAGLALALADGPFKFQSPVTAFVANPATSVDTTPVRTPLPRAEYPLGRFTFQCNECHRSLPLPYVTGHRWTNHAGIFMAHGINNRCLNCHNEVNRETFVDDYGQEIPWDQPQILCAKCHGPVYRDWQHGSHGRINGYWDRSRGEQIRLKCIQCHDPHNPRFPPLASTPGPRTLRVDPHHPESHSEFRNPLRIKDNLRTDQYSHGGGEQK